MTTTPTAWIPADSGTVTSTSTSTQRLEQNNTVRKEQDGTIRILQPNQVIGRVPTIWSDL